MNPFSIIATVATFALPLGFAGGASAQTSPNSPGAKFLNCLLTGGPRWAPVPSFDVAGVKLGMTPEQTRAALVRSGFSPTATDPTQDAWSAVVSQRVAERIGGKVDDSKVPRFTRVIGPQGEQIEVWYAATREGARATSVYYTIPTNRMERSAFDAGVSAKYGAATVQGSAFRLYCVKGEIGCQTYTNRSLPHLLVENEYAMHSIRLMEGGRYGEELKAMTAAAVEAAAPKNAKASF